MSADQGEFFRVLPFPSKPRRWVFLDSMAEPFDLRKRIESDIADEEKQIARRNLAARFVEMRNGRAVFDENPCPPVPDQYRAEMYHAADSGLFDPPEVAADISAEDRAFAFSAHGEFIAACKERTGAIQSDEDQLKRNRQSAELLKLSEALCAKMGTAADPDAVAALCDEAEVVAASAGADRKAARKSFLPVAREIAPRFNPYRPDSGFEIRRYYLHSRQVDVLPNYRRIRFIPYVAQMLRAPLVAALDFWLSKNPLARFWTFTSGKRVVLEAVGDRCAFLHKRLRRLNKAKFMRDAGVKIVFHSTETGTPENDANGNQVDGGNIERDETGAVCFHVHAHCVVELTKGGISSAKWSKLLERVHRFWGFQWQDDGVISSSREVCKYVTKPAEMAKLTGDELVALEAQLSRVRLTETAGSLRDEIDERQTAGKRLVKRSTPDGRVYVAVKDWNKHVRRTRTEESQDAAGKLTPKAARGMVRIVSRGVPRFGDSGVAEPCVTTLSLRGSWKESEVRSHPLVAPVIQATAHKYFEGVSRRASPVLGISVHTRTLTVPEVSAERPARPRGKPKRARMGAARAGF